ncbi:MAG: succinate dehydrogenase/fumarate reductase iron-sulfur subunit [Proteobacteria bacterium]|nr:succinate dehydrogenase/fumarate reductase iron-sulfur subunit [Pseudomonadota bacterium]
MSQNIKIFSVLRYRPETDDAPHFEDFEVPWTAETSILDGLNYIRDNLAPDLSYRSSCRMAICGSCAMVINNVPRLACKTFVRNYEDCDKISIEPLENFPIERDLVTDISDMIGKLESVHPYIVPRKDIPADSPSIQTPQQLARYQQFSHCIQCGCCYAACPQYKLHKDFIGPAALTMLYRCNHDSRDAEQETRTAIMSQTKGVWRCTSVGYCSDVCPKLVDPAAAIQLGKEESAKDYFLRLFKLKK